MFTLVNILDYMNDQWNKGDHTGVGI